MKAILVGISTNYDHYDITYSLDELCALAKVLGYETVAKFYQIRKTPDPKTYIGSGKLNEIIMAIHGYNADIVIFNDELTPSQMRNNEEILGIDVIDRSYLILKIFEQNAKTKSAKLEIKLAKNLYLLPRIQFLREKESRTGGTSGAMSNKGSGETQRELDKRHLLAEINSVSKELEALKKMKQNQILKRKKNEIPIVSLVGYTNAGKSSTMNTLLKYTNKNMEVLEKDQLFATLDTSSKKITYKKRDFILVDTVGFVSKLPHGLINSFYGTLEEIKQSNLIILVMDSSSKYINEELNITLNTLYQLGIKDIPIIFLFNKWDNTIDQNMDIIGKKCIRFSNKYDLNHELLLDEILSEIGPYTYTVKLMIPYKCAKLLNIVLTEGNVTKKEFRDNYTYIEAEIPAKIYHLFKDYDIDTMAS